MECHSSSIAIWTADVKAHVLSSATEQVYNAFFYTTSMHLLCQQSEEVLFGHFMTMLNAASDSKLALEDEGYESGSENFNIPTPLRCIPRIHHVSSDETSPLTPLLHAAQPPVGHIASLYDTGYHSVPLTMKKVPQLTSHLLTAQRHCQTPWVLHSSHVSSPSMPCVMTWK